MYDSNMHGERIKLLYLVRVVKKIGSDTLELET